ncbi:SLC13 family permease [Lujinxingia litoralis]|uniref:SLC13 family permease n=1 Tax=Lujinxingia litoralis TaxID=2211119 RepID=A0A328CBK9_9DELT|nr:SLC13 family permease [Lujinxingia litoralis]RAL22877.1 SLC13 family permease [Lujinxingia litoralis]
MNFELSFVFLLTLIALVLFVTERMRVDLVALLTMAALLPTGIITPAEGLSGFSNEATVTIAAMFVLSRALHRTGALKHIATHLGRLYAYNERLATATMMIGVAAMSAFINNVAVVAIMLPVLLGVCRANNLSPSRVMMPLSFAAIFGGTCTLVGTSTNILISGLLTDLNQARIGMFETTVVGLAFLVVGTVYMLTIGRALLPQRDNPDYQRPGSETQPYLTELQFGSEHPDIGKPASLFVAGSEARLLAMIRKEVPLELDEDPLLRADDILRISAPAAVMRDLLDTPGITSLADPQPEPDDQPPMELLEVVIAPDASVVGRTLGESRFARYHPARVLALRRAADTVVEHLLDVPIQGGDVLLIQALPSQIPLLQESPDFIVVSEIGLWEFKHIYTLPVLAALIAVVSLAAFGVAPIVTLASAAAVLVVLLGVISIEEAYEAIDWQVIFLLGGLIPLGIALQKTGGVALLSNATLSLFGDFGPWVLLGAFYLITTVMTAIISNQATAVLITPVAVSAALSLGVDPRPFIFAIVYGASASFASPVGYHTNVMIYSAGGYRYMDFVRVGVPLSLLFLIIALVLIPWYWPL